MLFNRRAIAAPLLLLAVFMLPACSYTVPVQSRRADLGALSGMTEQQRRSMTDVDVAAMMNRKPLARFPATMAVVQLQSNSGFGLGRGGCGVVLTRDEKTNEYLQRIAGLSKVRGVTTLSRLVLPSRIDDDRDLRAAAARLNADLLLIYTFDTSVYRGDTTSPLDVVTFGFLPHKYMRVESTASALLMDTRNGYIYATAESASSARQLANSWTSSSAMDQSRRRAEAEALEQLVDDFVASWPTVLAMYDPQPSGAVMLQQPTR